ncbi:hypothetical protein C0971_10045 [Bacillus methanolicus]|uniref:hypothetical protein n=1 Tax=Bacillus methanolicus TaxID=1471 RepID=UPI00200E5CC4|nr:hypothetical protein [Bacillus methanolicus]UQD52313.1 hypothetical protein C0971_10045 [Bacillus methanolicus]
MKPHEQLQFEMALDRMKKMLPFYAENAETIAKMLKTHYDALVNAGFNEDQALEIVIAHGINIGGYQDY